MLDIGALFHIIFASETFIYCLESFHKVPPGKKPAGVFFHQVAMVGSWETPDLLKIGFSNMSSPTQPEAP